MIRKPQFLVEVYESGSEDMVIGCWPVPVPLPVAVGDVLRTGAIDPNALMSTALRVVRVEHLLMPGDEGGLRHKHMLFTEQEP